MEKSASSIKSTTQLEVVKETQLDNDINGESKVNIVIGEAHQNNFNQDSSIDWGNKEESTYEDHPKNEPKTADHDHHRYVPRKPKDPDSQDDLEFNVSDAKNIGPLVRIKEDQTELNKEPQKSRIDTRARVSTALNTQIEPLSNTEIMRNGPPKPVFWRENMRAPKKF
jgi:hypothetical protein